MAIKVRLNKLIIEMTRRCNAQCMHCMRGDAQDKDISIETINNIFKNDDHEIVDIDNLFLTGGEVFLSQTLEYLLNYLTENNIKVNHLGICINGLVYNYSAIDLLNILFTRGVDVYLETYDDQFHSSIPAENKEQLLKLPYYKYYENSLDDEEVCNIGRARDNNLGNVELTKEVLKLFLYKDK